MNGFTFSPALGWVAGGLLAAGLAVLAILEIALFVRRRASSDETVWACIRRTLMLLIVAVMVLTPSVVSSTTSQAINATDVIVAVDTTGVDGGGRRHIRVREDHYPHRCRTPGRA